MSRVRILPPVQTNGSVAERLIAPVSKTGVPSGTVGSNPTASAKFLLFTLSLIRFILNYEMKQRFKMKHFDKKTNCAYDEWMEKNRDKLREQFGLAIENSLNDFLFSAFEFGAQVGAKSKN